MPATPQNRHHHWGVGTVSIRQLGCIRGQEKSVETGPKQRRSDVPSEVLTPKVVANKWLAKVAMLYVLRSCYGRPKIRLRIRGLRRSASPYRSPPSRTLPMNLFTTSRTLPDGIIVHFIDPHVRYSATFTDGGTGAVPVVAFVIRPRFAWHTIERDSVSRRTAPPLHPSLCSLGTGGMRVACGVFDAIGAVVGPMALVGYVARTVGTRNRTHHLREFLVNHRADGGCLETALSHFLFSHWPPLPLPASGRLPGRSAWNSSARSTGVARNHNPPSTHKESLT